LSAIVGEWPRSSDLMDN